MDKENRVDEAYTGKEEIDMSRVKPIQATPVLQGEDAISFMKQAVRTPSESSNARNKRIIEVLNRIKK